jgi:NAD(P)-dependent dehydrogenase (short-subunit alcohol dehydrogenase family)
MTVARYLDSFRLDGQVALVTGGGQGLGRAISEGLAECGAKVAVVDRNATTAQETVDAIGSSGGSAMVIECDVADETQARQAVATAADAFGDVDVLVANAGIGDRSPAEKMTIEQWDRVIAVNLRGTWLFDQEVGRRLIERKRPGSIVNMASIAGQVGLTTGNANYAASKGAIIALTRCLAIEWAAHRIRVNGISPTHFRTPLVEAAIAKDSRNADYFLHNIPLGRLGVPSDIVGAAIFLASAASSMVTGHILNVDGGHTAV